MSYYETLLQKARNFSDTEKNTNKKLNFIKEWGGQLVTFIPEIKVSQNK